MILVAAAEQTFAEEIAEFLFAAGSDFICTDANLRKYSSHARLRVFQHRGVRERQGTHFVRCLLPTMSI